jgi:hypothetical protein
MIALPVTGSVERAMEVVAVAECRRISFYTENPNHSHTHDHGREENLEREVDEDSVSEL